MKESLKYQTKKVERRAKRVRAKISGSAARPRLSVSVSNQHLYAQCIDDVAGRTLLALSDAQLDKAVAHVSVALARELGQKMAKLALGQGITKVVFDRGARAYHGRVKAFAEGAREGGLQF